MESQGLWVAGLVVWGLRVLGLRLLRRDDGGRGKFGIISPSLGSGAHRFQMGSYSDL